MTFVLQTEAGARVQSLTNRINVYLYGLFIIPIFWGLYFLYNLSGALLEVRSSQRRLVDILPLIVITLAWNAIAITGTWNGAITPLVQRWLVSHGQAAVGEVTKISVGRQTCQISYSFCPEQSPPVKGSIVVSKKLCGEIGEPNAKITILYSQKNPKWNVPYRWSGYEVSAN